jgi:hypothetical protein
MWDKLLGLARTIIRAPGNLWRWIRKQETPQKPRRRPPNSHYRM